MIKVDVVVSVARDGFYSVYCKDYPALFCSGDTVEAAVAELKETLRITGIHPKQLWAYQHGRSKPRRKQIEKIESALHKLGRELSQVTFC